MEQAFAEFYSPDPEDIERLWTEGIVTFDTSSLLNMYELSPIARKEILDAMRLLKDKNRLWMSHQVGLEFHRNRTVVASQIANRLNELKSKLAGIKRAFAKDAKHLDITQQLLSDFDEMDKKLARAIEGHSVSGKKHPTAENDDLLSGLNKLFDRINMVGEPISKKQSKSIYKEGRRRYAANTPPGFMDNEKTEPFKFGDLIVWVEIINIAKARRLPVILVSDDRKDDWMYDFTGHDGRVTHPLLRVEFKTKSGEDFWSYSSEDFLKEAKQRIKADISDDTIGEVRDAREAETYRRSTEPYGPRTNSYFTEAIQNMTLPSYFNNVKFFESPGLTQANMLTEQFRRNVFQAIQPDLDLARGFQHGVTGFEPKIATPSIPSNPVENENAGNEQDELKNRKLDHSSHENEGSQNGSDKA